MLDTPQRDQVTVEAETVEDALAEISTELGEDAEIVRAQKLHRGGVGGFFAKEIVQLTARRRRDEAPALRPRAQGSGITEVLERMAQDADAEDSDFRTVLQRELGPETSEPTAAEFLASVGWDESSDDVVALPSTAGSVDVAVGDEHVVPSFAEVDGVPDPVAVGPALRAVPEPPTFTPEESPVADLSEAEPEPVVETDTLSEPIAGPVVPLREAESTDLDEAAAADAVIEDIATQDVAEELGSGAPVAEAVTDEFAEPAEPANWRTAEPNDAPEGMGSVGWSTTSLLRIGLPGPVISAVGGLESNDDLGWIEGIAAAVAPHCGPLPEGDVIVVGPHAERLAEPLGLPLVRSGEMAPYAGSFCAMVEDSAQDRQWLEFVRGGRGIHLVVGDEPWQDLLLDEPVAVSWVGESAVADALYLAFTLGATLGYGTVDGFVSSMVRAQPTDVALAVRRIVGRQ